MATIKKPAKKYADGGFVNPTKKTTKKPKTASQTIGDLTLRDVKNAGEDALQIVTLGGYGKVKKAFGGEYKYKKLGEKKNGGTVKKAKSGANMKKSENGSAFAKLAPPYNKATFADKIAGATKNKAKSGTSMKKCKTGCK